MLQTDLLQRHNVVRQTTFTLENRGVRSLKQDVQFSGLASRVLLPRIAYSRQLRLDTADAITSLSDKPAVNTDAGMNCMTCEMETIVVWVEPHNGTRHSNLPSDHV